MAAISSFDSLSDEIALKIITLASDNRYRTTDNPRDAALRPDFLLDVLCKVSVRFRRLATDSSLWRDSFIGITLHPLSRTMHDFSKLEFLIRECLNGGTKKLAIIGAFRHLNTLSMVYKAIPLVAALTHLARMFPNVKRVDLYGIFLTGIYIPAPWNFIQHQMEGVQGHTLWSDKAIKVLSGKK